MIPALSLRTPPAGETSAAVAAISVDGITVRYGSVVAVDDLSLTVEQGEIFGLLGPNGAGKTTTLSVIEGLLVPDAGTVHVLGFDHRTGARDVKQALGVSLQTTTFIDHLKVWELVRFYAALYGIFLDKAEILGRIERFGLAAKAEALAEQLSGGQQQRLALALSVVNDPRILILDEPSTGLDPQARRNVWDIVRGLREEGRTVVITTHSMEEAQELCDRVGIVDHGRLVALDSPARLINSLGGDSVVTMTARLPTERLRTLPGVTDVALENGRITLRTRAPYETVLAVQALAVEHRQALTDLRLKEPNLEDVFLALTGREIREPE